MFSHNLSNQAPPNPDIYKNHFARGEQAFKAGRYDEAQIHFVDAAEVMERLVSVATVPEVRKYREEALRELLDLAKLCGETPKPILSRHASSEVNGDRGGGSPTSRGSDDGSTIDVKRLLFKDSKVKFEHVVGHEFAKKQIQDRMIGPFQNPEYFQAYNVPAGGATLFFGPPGTGKTDLAAAAAGEMDADFYVVRGSDLVSKWFGDAEKNVRQLFEGIRKASRKAVLFLDDCAALMGRSEHDASGVQGRVLGELLNELDGMGKRNGKQDSSLLFIANTNEPWVIAENILSRFEGGIIYMGLPNESDRGKILQLRSLEQRLASDVDFKEIAFRTEGYSGRDLKAICMNVHRKAAAESAARSQLTPITQDMYLKEIDCVRPKVTSQDIKKFEAWTKDHAVSSDRAVD